MSATATEETNGRSQSLYRKYRPATFAEDDLVGQEHVSRTLRNAVRHGRVAHAYLFCGPRGTGKTSSARLLAKAVNCEDSDPAKRPCNRCAACRAINEGRATDIIEIDAASNRGIEDIRDLREKVKFAPAQLSKKFYIIDEVHQLTREASNALLKTLEEPPPHAIFILATTDAEKVLDTISSRCQTFTFHRFPTERIAEHLRRVADKEGIRATDDALTLIARSATGAMRDALGLLDQLSSFGATDEGITADTVRQLLGAGDSAQVAALVDAIAAGDTGEGLRVINAVVDGGADVRQFAAQLVGYLRDLLHASAAAARGGAASASGVEVAHLTAFSLPEIAELVKRFSQVDYGLRHSSYGHLPLELCLVDCILARNGETPAARPATDAPRALPARPEPRPASAPATRPTPVASESAAPPERLPTPLRPVAAVPPPAPIPAPPPTLAPAPAAARATDDDWASSLVPETASPALRPAAVPTPSAAPTTTAAASSAPAAAAPTTSPARPALPAPPAPSIGIDAVRDQWSRIRQLVRASSRRIEALLASVDPLQIDDETLTLVAAYDFHRDGLNKDDTRKVIEEVVAQVFGHPYRVRCVNQEDARALGPAPATATPDPPVASPVAVAPAPPVPAPDHAQAAEEAPPWQEPTAAPTPPAPVQPAAPDPAPARPQAHMIRETAAPRPADRDTPAIAVAAPAIAAAPATPATIDERYIGALRNLFNAEEIRPEGPASRRPRWEN